MPIAVEETHIVVESRRRPDDTVRLHAVLAVQCRRMSPTGVSVRAAAGACCGMRTGLTVTLSAPDRLRLEALMTDRNSPQTYGRRAGMKPSSAVGLGTYAIVHEAGVTETVVWRRQDRCAQEDVEGLVRDETRPVRIPPIGPEGAVRVVAPTQGEQVCRTRKS